jgi:hypothetical protein
MGCGGSKEVDEKEIRKINYEFKTTKVPKFDEFFNTAARLLEQAENIRAGLQDAREEGAELADTWKLKEYSYNDTVMVLFWALSANGGGDIKRADVWVGEEAPFITLKYYDGLLWETRELCDTFQNFLKAVCDGPSAMLKIVEETQTLNTQGQDLVKNGFNEAKNAGLSALDAGKAASALGSNMAKFGKQLPKLKTLQGLAKDAFEDLKKLAPKFKEIVANCDEIGKKAHAANVGKPKDIFEKFHPGPKKTPQEIEAEQKAAEEAKKKKEKKKGKKKEGEKKEGEKKEGEKKEGEQKH